MVDPVLSMMRAIKLRAHVDLAVAAARSGERVVWAHPDDSPPPPWAEKELREAGVELVPSSGKLSGARAGRIDMVHM